MPISKIKTSSIVADAASVNLNIDAGTLYLDAANNRVGINNTSPAAGTALTVVGNVKAGYDTATGLVIGNRISGGVPANDVNSYIFWGDNTTFGGANGDMIYIPRTSTTASHRFYSGNGTPSERLRIEHGGNVLIGTDTALSDTRVTIKAGSGQGATLRLQQTDSTANSQILFEGTKTFQIGTGMPSSAYSNILFFYDAAAGAERMRIDSVGNVSVIKDLYANRHVLRDLGVGPKITGSQSIAAGWYRFARSADGGTNSYGARGGCKFYMYTSGGWAGPGQTEIKLFKDYSTNGALQATTQGSVYFSDWRLTMDSNYCYLEGYTGGFSMGGDNTWQCLIDAFGWDSGGWTVYNETLTAGLSSPAHYIRANYRNINGRVTTRTDSYPDFGDEYIECSGVHAQSAFDNPTIDLLTITGTPVIYANMIAEVEVWQTPWSNVSAGSIHTGTANWGNQGSFKNVTTMTNKTLPAGSQTNVGTLSWSGNTLRYTCNRSSNYDHYTIKLKVRHQELNLRTLI